MRTVQAFAIVAMVVWTVVLAVWRRIVQDRSAFLRRLLFHWYPLGLYALVLGFATGALGGALGIPKLYREDSSLASHGVWAHRNSPVIWWVFAATLYLAQLFSVALHYEALHADPPELPTFESHRRVVLRQAVPLAGYAVLALLFPVDTGPAPSMDGYMGYAAHSVVEALFGVGLGALVYVGALRLAYVWVPYLYQTLSKRRNPAPRVQIDAPRAWSQRLAASRALAGFREQTDRVAVIKRAAVIERIAIFGGCSFGGAIVLGCAYGVIVPAVSIALLLAYLLLAYFALLVLTPVLRIALLLATAGWIWFCASPFVCSDKQKIPTIDYEKVAIADSPGCPSEDPLVGLSAWKTALGAKRPKLVVLATSGGAYRAGFYTAKLLDAMSESCKARIRLVTGASGGMVAAAYFTALRGEGKVGSVENALESDILAADAGRTKYALGHDSLSLVAQQLVQRDIPRLLCPRCTKRDRGNVLEEQWGTLARTTFGTLEQQELAGRSPFLVLTPTVVETGAPLFVSNLNLYDLGVSQLLCEHPEAKAMSLATAVRLNATFPYVSPAVAIPTTTKDGRERLVDAGYFDNYGLSSALAILSMTAVRQWIEQETSGIVLVQIQASVSEPHPPPRALRFLTSPPEAVASSRDDAMLQRGKEEIRTYQALLASDQQNIHDEPSRVRLESFEFPLYDTGASMSWYLTPNDIERLQAAVGSWASRLAMLEQACEDEHPAP